MKMPSKQVASVRKPKPDRNLLLCHPDLAPEWSAGGANGSLTPTDVRPASRFFATWRCLACEHEWTARVADRTRGRCGCPGCAVLKDEANSLAARYPDLAAQWDFERNAPHLRPDSIPWSSNLPVAWICPKGPDHKWIETPNRRTAKGRNATGQGGCPFCANFRVSVVTF